jgi:hypothetical protein
MQEVETTLLDLHLGRLSREEADGLRARIAADPVLARRDAALASVFAVLRAGHDMPAAPADLAERIAARVAAAGRAPRVVREERGEVLSELEGQFVLRVRSLRDVIAVAATIVLAVGLGLPALLQVRERNLRSLCAANMARLGQGVQAYATAFGDSLPFVGWQRGANSWRPTAEPGVATLPNRRHMYLLLTQGNAQPQWFLCPSSAGVPMPSEQVRQRDDFLDSSNVSLAFQNMAGARPTANQYPNLPIFADDNPSFDDGRPLFDVSHPLDLLDPTNANSRAHGGAGQNVLTLDGHVLWTTTPACGIDGDNIWTLNGVERYTGREGPAVESDSHLLK